MNNLFEYLDSYIKHNSAITWGDLKSNKQADPTSMLSRDEREIYEQIKESDRNRLIRFQ